MKTERKDLYKFVMRGYGWRAAVFSKTEDEMCEILDEYLPYPSEAFKSTYGFSYLIKEAIFFCWKNGLVLSEEHDLILRTFEELDAIGNVCFEGHKIKFDDSQYARKGWVSKNPDASWLDYSAEEFLAELEK